MEAVELLVSSILSHTDEQILVISSYTQILDYFGSFCDSKNWGYFRLDGQTDVAQRQSLVNSFNHRYTSKRLFILSARAGGVGLNITGADVVVHYDPWWNPAAEAQATDRAHRIGQTRAVTSVKLAVADSVEERVLFLQREKRRLLEELFEASAAENAKISLAEMRELLK